MNERQRVVLKVLLMFVGLSLFFPPFDVRLKDGVTHNAGYSFLFLPPETAFSIEASVNSIQLLIQILGLCAIGFIAYLLAASSNSDYAEPNHVREETEIVVRRKHSSIYEALRRSRLWFLVAAVFISLPILSVQDNYQLAIKLLINSATSLLILTMVVSYYFAKIRGERQEQGRKVALSRNQKIFLFGFCSVLLLLIAVWVGFYDQPPRDLFQEAGIEPTASGNPFDKFDAKNTTE